MGLHLRDLPDWPACLDASEAVAYTGVAASEITRATRMGQLSFRAVGPRGRKVVPRHQLDTFLASLFTDGSTALLEDMDFGSSQD